MQTEHAENQDCRQSLGPEPAPKQNQPGSRAIWEEWTTPDYSGMGDPWKTSVSPPSSKEHLAQEPIGSFWSGELLVWSLGERALFKMVGATI